MEKHIYKSLYDSYTQQITELQNKQNALRDEYIEEKREFQNGDAVIITNPKDAAIKCFISTAYEVGGNIYYKFIGMKKDGNPSSRDQYISSRLMDSNEIVITLLHTEYRNKNWDGSPIIL